MYVVQILNWLNEAADCWFPEIWIYPPGQSLILVRCLAYSKSPSLALPVLCPQSCGVRSGYNTDTFWDKRKKNAVGCQSQSQWSWAALGSGRSGGRSAK